MADRGRLMTGLLRTFASTLSFLFPPSHPAPPVIPLTHYHPHPSSRSHPSFPRRRESRAWTELHTPPPGSSPTRGWRPPG